MSADYSRWPVRTRDFTQVRLQQGRVLTDADWNEQALVAERRERFETMDGLGRAVVPTASANAFAITVSGSDLSIGVGRAYVDGLLVENYGTPGAFDPITAERMPSGPVLYSTQPWLRNPPNLPAAPYAAYLKAWQRERTAVEEPSLIEQALGVDTAARLQTVWQIKTVSTGPAATCDDLDALIAAAEPAAAGRLTNGTAVVPGQPDPCRVVPGGGYTGLENQLYRVEIHRGGVVGGAGGATFKWSRDNATVSARVESIGQARNRLVVDSLGPDDVLSFHDGDWVEILDDDHELGALPGELRQIQIGGGIDKASRTIVLTDALPSAAQAFPVDAQLRTLPDRNTRIRRWDQAGKVLNSGGGTVTDLDAANATGAILVPASNVSVLLEHGIVVRFSTEGQGRFRTGDFWLFAARTADASVEVLAAAPPLGVHAHYAPLAIIGPNPSDCRTIVPPLAEMDTLHYLGGDGQEATPSYLQPAPITLPVPIAVGVSRGSLPVAGRTVRFTIVDFPNAGSLPGAAQGTVEIDTPVNGIISLVWTLGWDGRESQKKQEVVAELLDGVGQPIGLPIRFSARLRTADLVAYDPAACADLAGAGTVQQALDALCGRDPGEGCCLIVRPGDRLPAAIEEAAARGKGHACLCLTPGVYELSEDDSNQVREILGQVLTLTIGGRGAQILLGAPLVIEGLQALDIREVQIANATEQLDVVLDIVGCGSVTLDGIEANLTNGSEDSRVVRMASPEAGEAPPAIRIRNCTIQHGKRVRRFPREEIVGELPATIRAMVLMARSESPAGDTVSEFRNLMDQPEERRVADADMLDALATEHRDLLDVTTNRAINRLSSTVREGRSLPLSRLTTLLDRARLVGDRFIREFDAGTAVEIVDGRSDVWLDSNQLRGKVMVYGSGARPDAEARLQEVLEGIDWFGIEPGAMQVLPPGVAGLRLSKNTLARITIGGDGVEAFLRFLETREFPDGLLFDSVVLDGNDMSDPRQAVLGQLVSLASNTIGGGRGASMGFACGNVATMSGNIGTNGEFLLAAWESAEAANRRMKIHPGTHP